MHLQSRGLLATLSSSKATRKILSYSKIILVISGSAAARRALVRAMRRCGQQAMVSDRIAPLPRKTPIGASVISYNHRYDLIIEII